HLDVIVDRLKIEFKVEANVGAPQVAYRETFRTSGKTEGKFIRQSGGRGQYGHVWVEFEPNEVGEGFVFENKIVGGVVPRDSSVLLKKVLKKRWKVEYLQGIH